MVNCWTFMDYYLYSRYTSYKSMLRFIIIENG